jgi:3-hydroxyisobutyrate dehydrogenase
MGEPMAGHLLAAGHDLRVYSRTRSRASRLLDAGAVWADAPADAACGADVVISIVGFPEDVEEVHLGRRGTLRADELPSVIIDMTTSRPSLAARIADEARARGVEAVDAPVSGGDVGARNAALSIMVGAEPNVFDRVLPLFELLGQTVVLQGGPGAGQHCKMVNQILVAASMIGAVEGLRYADAAGLDGATVLASVSAGAAGSWTITNLAPRILKGDFAPGFFVEHFVKDLRIAMEEADAMGLDLPGLSLAKQAYERLCEAGHGQAGTHALAVAY